MMLPIASKEAVHQLVAMVHLMVHSDRDIPQCLCDHLNASMKVIDILLDADGSDEEKPDTDDLRNQTVDTIMEALLERRGDFDFDLNTVRFYVKDHAIRCAFVP